MRYSCLGLVLALGAVGCSNTDALKGDGGSADQATDGVATTCVDESADYDKDGLSNGIEGCKEPRHSDGDGIADWQDFDSDDDGVQDRIEAGEPGRCRGPKPEQWPCDSDGDGTPDYLDLDSDGDGLEDKYEDVNGDGRVGCCLRECGKPTSAQKDDCTLAPDGCGPGQSCDTGFCAPVVAFRCSKGETSPLVQDTFGDGVKDGDRGGFICRDATEADPRGRKSIRLARSTEPTGDSKSGNWHLAMEPSARYGELKLDGQKDREAAAVIDHNDARIEVAGFVVSLPAPAAEPGPFVDTLIQRLQTRKPGGAGSIAMRSAGARTKSHDKFDAIHHTTLEIALDQPADVSTVRTEVIAALLERSAATLDNVPLGYGASHRRLVLSFSTVRRFNFARDGKGMLVLDEEGYPMDDGAHPNARRLLVIGSVAGADNYEDATRPTGFVADDLAGGSQLATYDDEVTDDCDVGHEADTPRADVIWVVDESQSVTDLTGAIRDGIQHSAAEFFSRAKTAGLDFRMGVTGIVSPHRKHDGVRGKLCSEALTDPDGAGGDAKVVDRFLLPSEETLFGQCVNNPYGREGGAEYGLHTAQEAVKRHLDDSVGAPGGVLRKNAKTVVIIATDEPSKTVIDETFIPNTTKSCQFGPSLAQEVQTAVDPFIAFFRAQRVDVHLIGFVCSSLKTCAIKDHTGRGVAHGYVEVVRALGGIMGDVCQKDLSKTMQAIVDNIVGAASPIRLERIPIATSLAVAVAGVEIPRSRSQGFDYNPAKNSIAFYGGVAKPGQDVVVSYKRWHRQAIIE